MQPRFRIFAGPNGSGKTHLFNYLHDQGFINEMKKGKTVFVSKNYPEWLKKYHTP